MEKLSGRNVINQQPAFYCIQLNELNMHNDTLMLHYPSNYGENTAPAEKLAEELVVRVLNLMMGCNSGLYIEWQENFYKCYVV